MIAWLYFALVQLVTLVATVIGWLLLIPFCLASAWEPCLVRRPALPPQTTDRWRWGWVDAVWGNPSADGVSGHYALIWRGGHQVPYMPDAWPPWRAYCWCAWRNSADALKYVFAWENGPFITWTWFGHQFKAGWQRENGVKAPVLS